jgi:hypothetical protein
MKKIILIGLAVLLLSSFAAISQQKKSSSKSKSVKTTIPFAGFLYGGCGVSNPISVLGGIQRVKTKHFSIVYDIHYWNTKYDCHCGDTYSKGKFSSFTPSIKFMYNTGKKPGNGLFLGVGMGYMFAKDRGTEQTYTLNPVTNSFETGKNIITGKWDFNSIAPSATWGVGFRVAKFPVAINNTWYFAKTTYGWDLVTGGMGLKLGLKKFK